MRTEINNLGILTLIMCGRYAFYLPPAKLKSFFGLENLINMPEKEWARYNCAPMQDLPIVIKNRMGFARWGFRPEWSKEDDLAMASKMINARSESVAEKPSFRGSWAANGGSGRRCIVPVSGFFEWKKQGGTGRKQPYYIQHKTDDILCLAGLWSKVDDVVSFTVLTKQADNEIADYHHRMPVMLKRDQVAEWFHGDVRSAHDLIDQASGASCRLHAVGQDVGKVANDYEGLITPVNVPNVQGQEQQSSLGL